MWKTGGGGGDERGIEITALQSIQLATGNVVWGGGQVEHTLRITLYVKHQLTQETDIPFRAKKYARVQQLVVVLYVLYQLIGFGLHNPEHRIRISVSSSQKYRSNMQDLYPIGESKYRRHLPANPCLVAIITTEKMANKGMAKKQKAIKN